MAPLDKTRTVVPVTIHDTQNSKVYVRGSFLGEGGFARCYKVKDRDTNQSFACKIVNKTLLSQGNNRKRMAQEIYIHRKLNHPYIVGYVSDFEDPFNVYLILELCANKSLLEMQKRRKVITETEARYFVRQIMLAVEYLHNKKNFIHRDMKLGNIFINDEMNLKVGDLGLAAIVEHNGDRKRTICGTPNYIAPEILTESGHGYEVDIWSVGCILYTMLVGRPPFESPHKKETKETYSRIKRGTFLIPENEQISESAKTLITQMLIVDPSQRPTALQVLNSDFLTKLSIPLNLPVSSLTTEPRFDTRRSTRIMQQSGPSTVSSANPFKTKTMKRPLQAVACMKELRKQLRSVLAQTEERNGKFVSCDDDSEDPNSAPLLWISKWVDCSDKYGFGYQLSDDSLGVSYNDLTRMVLLNDGVNMHYVDKFESEFYHTKTNFPEDLQKKVKLLNYFQQYMNENLIKAGGNMRNDTANMTRLPSMWTWFRTSGSVVMVLSNGALQINNFKDHNKIILCPLMGAITTLRHHQPMRTYTFSSIERLGCTPALRKDLVYAMEKVEVILATKSNE